MKLALIVSFLAVSAAFSQEMQPRKSQDHGSAVAEKGLASGIPNQPLLYAAIGTFYVKRLDEYHAAIGPNLDAISPDFANHTSVASVILVSELVR